MPSLDRARAWILDVAWLQRRLDEGRVWPHGPLADVRGERIGEGFGLSGEVYRLHVVDRSGSIVTLVAKAELAPRIRTATTIRRFVEARLSGSVPRCLGFWIESGDTGDEIGVILLDDVSPAIQGDELAPTTRPGAHALVRVIARLHDIPAPEDADVERWHPRPADPALWHRRLAAIGRRHRGSVVADQWGRIEPLDERARSAALALAESPTSWIHVDPHFDNVLWRPDGSVVLLDWSNARVGPSAVDIAVLLFSMSFASEPCLSPDEVIAGYVASTTPSPDLDATRRAVHHALTVHLRGVAGWAGQPHEPGSPTRKTQLRDDAIGRVFRALEWLDETA